jgi:hypothetical protein
MMEIQKSTYVEADEETTKALTFDLLSGLHAKIDKLTTCYEEHLGKCDGRFKKLENQKKLNATLSGLGGILGGIISYFTGAK